MDKGLFFVLEGSDGSGKTTQFKLLKARLEAAGHNVDVYDFPRYGEPSSHFVKRYLNGEYGPASEISPYSASLFYALDRFESAPQIRRSLDLGKIVLANRYVGSNMAHQGAKFTKPAQQRGFFIWEESLEFQLLGVPRPTLNIYLSVPAEVSYELIKGKKLRSYTDKVHDEHEADKDHLRKSVQAYDSLCRLFPKDFIAVDCLSGDKIATIPDISNKIWKIIKPMLPKPHHNGQSATVNLKDSQDIQPANRRNNMLSVNPDVPKDNSAGIIELKDISLLAASRMMAIVGNDMTISLDWPARNKVMKYYIPKNLPPAVLRKYNDTMQRLIEIRRQFDESKPTLNHTIAAAITPMAALCDVGIVSSGLNKNRIEKFFQTSRFEELTSFKLGSTVQDGKFQANATSQTVFEALTNDIAKGGFSSVDQSGTSAVLAKYSPRNEFELIEEAIYTYGNLGQSGLATMVDKWDYEQKSQILKSLCASNPEELLTRVWYQFDCLADFGEIYKLAQSTKNVATKAQPLTPRYGYEVPPEVDASLHDDAFLEAFDASLELNSLLQSKGMDEAAQYSVLRGNHNRWQLSLNGLSLIEAAAKKPPGGLVQSLKDLAAEVHPIIIGNSHILSTVVDEGEAPVSGQRLNTKSRRRGRQASSRRHHGKL